MNGLKTFIKKNYIILFLLTIFAFGIRLLGIDKPSGLWYDETLTYVFSSASFPLGIIKTLLKYDFHMPLYYLLIHIWMKIFGTSDIALRFSSIIWGVFTIPAFFYLGKIYKSEKFGLFFSGIGALSPILIYFSQEFRFYSMLVFLVTVAITCFLKLVENVEKKILLLFCITNLVILYIYTMGIIFVFAEFLLLFIHFFLYKKEAIKILSKFLAGFVILAIPYFWLLISYLHASSVSITSPFISAKGDISTMILGLNDLFSPFLVSQYADGKNSYQTFLTNEAGYILVALFSITTICFLIGLIYEIAKGIHEKNNKLIYLATIATIFLGYEILLVLQSNLVFIPKYTLICFPILLLISCSGLLSIKSKKVKTLLISIILLTYVWNLINYKKMPSFADRSSGFKVFCNEIKNTNLSGNDYILYPSSTNSIKKYLEDTNVNFISLDLTSALYLDKSKQEASKLFTPNFIKTTTKKSSSTKLIQYIKNPIPSKELTNFIRKETSFIPINGRLIIAEKQDKNRFSSTKLTEAMEYTEKDSFLRKEFKNMVYFFMVNKLYNDIDYLLSQDKSLRLEKTFSIKGNGKKSKIINVFVYRKIAK